MGKAREYSAELRKYGSAIRSRRGLADQGDSDAADLFEQISFRGHFEDAGARSSLLRGLIKARGAGGLTQAEVANAMETTQSAISELEGGTTDPRLSTLQRYARAVGAHLQVRLNLFPSIAQEPSQWPTLAAGGTATDVLGLIVTAAQSDNYVKIITSGGSLTDKRDIPEFVAS